MKILIALWSTKGRQMYLMVRVSNGKTEPIIYVLSENKREKLLFLDKFDSLGHGFN